MVMDFSLLESRAEAAVRGEVLREGFLPDGALWSRFYRTDQGYLVRFPKLADFEISKDDLAVACRPAPSTTRDTCLHLYLNQVVPLVLSKRGKLVFHASTVEVAGTALAFVAEAGRGKSTLATAFATAGYRFMTDDCLVVETSTEGFHAVPSHPSIRLWDDSRNALVDGDAHAAPPVQYTAKTRLLAGARLAFCAEPRPLRVAYFLGDGSAPRLRIERMNGSEAVLAWLNYSFLLDPDEQPVLASHFDRVADLSNRLPCFRLDFPRRFVELEGVRKAIIAHSCPWNG